MAYVLIKIVGRTAWLDRPVGAEARFPSEAMALDREAPLVAGGERDLAEKCVNSAQRGCAWMLQDCNSNRLALAALRT
jgi:hypothetical protein